jgi:hypothetical protein
MSSISNANIKIDATGISGNVNASGKTTSNDTSATDAFSTIFTKSNIIMLVWFLAIYLVIYFILGIFTSSQGQTNQKLMASRVFDFLVFIFLIATLGYSFFSLSNSDKEAAFKKQLTSLKDYIDAPLSILSVVLFIVVLYATAFITGLPMTFDAKPISIGIVESGAWIMFAIILIVNFFKYVLGISIIDLFSEWLSKIWNGIPKSSSDISGNILIKGNTISFKNTVTSPSGEVFNISNNLYTYDDARAICKSYGARLATYDDIEKSYNDGGEWCNYGWSEGQMIFYPTQKATWDELQKDPKKKNNCGRPGVNGGFIANPYIKFGINCFGKKPNPSEKDLEFMNAQHNVVTPKTDADALLDNKVKFWKDNADKLLHVSSFNSKKWSEY